jgi:predicted CoA-substrate-specific enzyme activase
MCKNKILGIDIGSVAIAFVVLEKSNHVVHTAYTFHQGQIIDSLRKLLRKIDLSELYALGYTSSSATSIHKGLQVDSRVAYITAAKFFHPGLRSLLIIGAEKFGLVSFNEKGEYLNYRSNTSCAAGTGNFLDQQAERLNLDNIQEFTKLAFNNEGAYPKIASRCAVFAKTDLIHAQQEGYLLGEICDGLSFGLAKNIVDAVLFQGAVSGMVAAGGVALNKAVIGHIEKLIGQSIEVDEHAHVYGAVGAAIQAAEDPRGIISGFRKIEDIVKPLKGERKYHYSTLQLKLSDYPDFKTHEQYIFRSELFSSVKPVEVDAYSSICDDKLDAFLGIDIGSTSTKALLLGHDKEVTAGFYTRTSGQPLKAVQVLFESIHDFTQRRNIQLKILGVGTTGSGRKFTGKIIGADSIIDEISAHARAAFELDPETDTIIEIGGQDSKFTTLSKGRVTFSVMNNVCAAGTGSFIEEQAKRLNCALEEYSDRVENVKSPMASDRCTVFMERDLNHYLMAGYTPDEILAAVLHSTRENYLTKVAVKGYIGNKIFFQGATAKNKALVAAFEQKLGKPVMVSRYCHLTGALGVALEIHDNRPVHTKFKGLGLYKKEIPVRTEVCELCTNHCKLRVAEIDSQVEAYGFLCGRDYDVKAYVENQPDTFRLIRNRKRVFRYKTRTRSSAIIMGIPAGLHLYEEISLWREFFDLLSIHTVTSEDFMDPVKTGKKLSGAEFCAPVAAMHGHVNYLKNKADFIFLPVFIEEPSAEQKKKQYCYYTQFISSVISTQKELVDRKKILMPLLKSSFGESAVPGELFRMLRNAGILDIRLDLVKYSYEEAKRHFNRKREEWRAIYPRETKSLSDIHIMILGRPYSVLSPVMNSNIPEIFSNMGIRAFYMDMLPNGSGEKDQLNKPKNTILWKYATQILDAAAWIARTQNCYPVLITSFKCSPDAFVIDLFKEILEGYQKPYLILQLDEHDSSVGYETRIEAAIRAFRNHRQEDINQVKEYPDKLPVLSSVVSGKKLRTSFLELMNEAREILRSHAIDGGMSDQFLQQNAREFTKPTRSFIVGAKNLKNKNLLFPIWDPYVEPLLEAALKHCGVNTHMIPATEASIKQSLSLNTGQCLPLNIIVQNAIDYIGQHRLDPANTALWIMKSDLSCNLNMFPGYMKKLLDDYGKGMEQVSVYAGDFIFYDFSLTTAINAYLAYMFGGYIRKLGCHLRPYEKVKGTTDKLIWEALLQLQKAFRDGKPKADILQSIVHEFESIETVREERCKVAIFGDLYVRDNDTMNQNLIAMVEANGGEVITTPYSEYIKIIADPIRIRTWKQGRFREYLKLRFLTSLIPLVEDKYRKILDPNNGQSNKLSKKEMDTWFDHFGIHILHRGESFENILKIRALIYEYPDLDLLIQTNPSYCCPSLVTEAMSSKIEEITGVPVVTIEYDGTSGIKNEDVIPYLKYRKKKVDSKTF